MRRILLFYIIFSSYSFADTASIWQLKINNKLIDNNKYEQVKKYIENSFDNNIIEFFSISDDKKITFTIQCSTSTKNSILYFENDSWDAFSPQKPKTTILNLSKIGDKKEDINTESHYKSHQWLGWTIFKNRIYYDNTRDNDVTKPNLIYSLLEDDVKSINFTTAHTNDYGFLAKADLTPYSFDLKGFKYLSEPYKKYCNKYLY